MLKYILFVTILASPGKSEQCPLGKYGETCDKNCSSHCALSSSDKAVYCDKLTGRCSEGCSRGWHGDQCNLRCSENCLNNVCNVQTGTCIKCRANYSGDYCETYEGTYPQKYEILSADTSTHVDATCVSVFVPVVVILIVIILITLFVIRFRQRCVGLQNGRGRDLVVMDCHSVLLAECVVQSTEDTELIVACKQGNLQKVRTILDQSLEDIDKRGKGGITAVMWAARRGHRELVDLLVRTGVDLKLVDDVGNNILHWACYGGHVAMVKNVASNNMVDINSRGRDGRTPLMCAARLGNKRMFQLLVSKGGLPSQEDADGNNILQLACWGGSVKIVDYIIQHDVVDINGRAQSGRTPLMSAAYNGHGDLFNLLVWKGADITTVDDAGDNVLHAACLSGYVDIVSRVLKLNKVDINSRGHYNRTPLMMAARIGEKEIFDLLLKEGADASLVDGDSNTILHHSSEGGNLDIVKYALGMKNVDINVRNKRNETAAMLATNGGDVCDLLVQRGGHVL